jgi:hypothetical protein
MYIEGRQWHQNSETQEVVETYSSQILEGLRIDILILKFLLSYMIAQRLSTNRH